MTHVFQTVDSGLNKPHSTNVCDPLMNGPSINKMSLKYPIV
jgi:hypothetical protein